MPQNVINGDFEGSPLANAPPFWTILSGSPLIKSDNPWAGTQYLNFPSLQNASVKQTFPSPVNAAQFSLWAAAGIGSIFNYKFYYADGTTETNVSPPITSIPFNVSFINKAVLVGGTTTSGVEFALPPLSQVLTNDFIFVGIEVLGSFSLTNLTDSQANIYTIFSSNYNASPGSTLIMAGTYATGDGNITVRGTWGGSDVVNFGAIIANYRGVSGIPTNIRSAQGNNVNITGSNPALLVGIGSSGFTGINQNNRGITTAVIPSLVKSTEFIESGTRFFTGVGSHTMTTPGPVFIDNLQTVIIFINILMQNATDYPSVTVTDSNTPAFYTYNLIGLSGPLNLNRMYVFTANIPGGLINNQPSITINVQGGTVQAWDATIQVWSGGIIQGINFKTLENPSENGHVNLSLPNSTLFNSAIAGYFYAQVGGGSPPTVGSNYPTSISFSAGNTTGLTWTHGNLNAPINSTYFNQIATAGLILFTTVTLVFAIIEINYGGIITSVQDKIANTAGVYNFSVPFARHVSVMELDATLVTPYYKFQRYFSPPKLISSIELNSPNTNTTPIGIDEVQLWDDSIGVERSDLPKYQALIFRGMHPESEDSWMRGFNYIGFGTSSTDGDVLTLYYSGSPGSNADYKIFFRNPVNLNIYKTAIVRTRGTAPMFNFYVQNGGNSYTIAQNQTTTPDWSIFTYDLSSSTISSADSFGVTTVGASSGQYTQWDFVDFCTGSYIDVSQDIININTKSSTQQIGDFSIDINNLNGRYSSGSNIFHYWDDIIIYGGYQTFTGSSRINYEKIFGGKLEEIIPRLSQTDGEVLSVSGQAYGNGLKNILAFAEYSSTGSLISNLVVSPSAGNIMNDVVNRFVNSTKVAYFTRGGSIVIVDQPTGYRVPTDMTGSGRFNPSNTIGGYASWQTGSLLYYYQVRQAPVWSALGDLGALYFSTQSTGSGMMIGDTPIQTIDYYVSPARALHFEQISQARIRGRHFGKVINAFPGNSDIIDVDLQADVNDMQNKINYFSSFWLPSTGDAWTEGDAASWTVSTGTADNPAGWSLVDNQYSQVGSYSVMVTSGSGAINNPLSTVFLSFYFPSGSNVGSSGSINFYNFGSQISIPFLYFYHWAFANNNSSNRAIDNGYFLDVRAETNANTDYYSLRSNGMTTGSPGTTNSSEFTWPGIYNNLGGWHYSGNLGLGIGAIPIGPYAPTGSGFNNWIKTGNPNWNNINRISIGFTADGTPGFIASGSVDGLHIESLRYDIATNSTSIQKYALREEFVTDPLIKDSGSAPLFAKAEILRFSKPIIRGTIKTAFYPTAHPAQLLTLNYPNGGYYNQDFRIMDVEHNISATEGATTTFTLNSDTGSTNPIHRSDMINAILNSSAVGNQSVIELLNVQFDPFLTPNIIDYPS